MKSCAWSVCGCSSCPWKPFLSASLCTTSHCVQAPDLPGWLVGLLFLTRHDLVDHASCTCACLCACPVPGSTLASLGSKWGVSLSGNPNFATLSYQGKWSAVSNRVLAWNGLAAVMIGIVLIVEIFTPMRSFLLVFMYWQMMQIQYMTNPHIKVRTRVRLCEGGAWPNHLSIGWNSTHPTPCLFLQAAFRQVDGRIIGLTQHRLCPGIVSKAYMKVRSWLAARVTPPAPGSQPQTPKCTIM